LVLGVLAVAAGVERVALVIGVQVVAGVVVCAPPDEGIGVVDAVRRLADDVRRKRAAVVALAVDGRRKRAVDVVLVVVLLVVVVLGAFAAVAVGGDRLVVVALQQVDELVAMV
jgi:hypothetical protein